MKRRSWGPLKTEQRKAAADHAEPACLTGPLPFYLAALGASAGGLEAMSSFFGAAPPDSGLAFVVVQHLSPTYKSHLAELLARRTSMPVAQVMDGVRVQANHVYVIPPDRCMSIFHGQLLLAPFTSERRPKLPIDHFFTSLAQDQGERSIGIILSGTGSDGVQGLRAIKEAGGVVLVQDERSALFSGMPHHAIATGLADRILSAAEMPAQLCKFVNHPFLVRPRRNGGSPSKRALEKLRALVRAQTGTDFSGYKTATLVRRLERRMGLSQIEDVDRYLDLLQQTPAELTALRNDFLISVTRFFRDAYVFQRLKETVIPALFTDAGKGQSIRVWVPGCATGEEAYSVAMLLDEHAATRPEAYSLKVFATDVNPAAVEFAAAGRYPASVAADVPLELLARYFTKEADAYRVGRRLRERVTFAVQNLLRDPPFTRVNLICCRNLLIYFQPPWQQKVLDAFHFALEPRGWLLLGSRKTVGERQPAFEPVDAKACLYRKRSSDFRAPAVAPRAALLSSGTLLTGEWVDPLQRVARPDALQAALYATLLADFVRTGFAVDERNEDLQAIQEDLQAAVQQKQAAHEESQATHEELIAANKALQSGNEGLESVNEELTTLNAEYQRKNEELLVANNDLENLLRTAEIGTIILDGALRIRKFTPLAAAELNLLAGDVGRLLTDLAHPLLRELARAALQALAEGRATDVTVDAPGKACYLLRIWPYAREGASEQGVVATLLNVSQLKPPSPSLANLKGEVKKAGSVPESHPTPRCASKQSR